MTKSIQEILNEQRQQSEIHKISSAKLNRSLANKEKANNPEFRKKISKSRKGKSLSENTINKLIEKSTGKKHTEKTKQKISQNHLGENNPMFGKKFSEDHKSKLKESHKNRIVTSETKIKLSRAKLGKSRPDNKQKMLNLPKVTCPHCKKQGQEKIMKRWHFDNCKHK